MTLSVSLCWRLQVCQITCSEFVLREVVVIVSQFNSPRSHIILLRSWKNSWPVGALLTECLSGQMYWCSSSTHEAMSLDTESQREGEKPRNYKPADINKDGFLHLVYSPFIIFFFYMIFFFWTNFLWFLNQISWLWLESFHIFRIIIERFVMRLNLPTRIKVWVSPELCKCIGRWCK